MVDHWQLTLYSPLDLEVDNNVDMDGAGTTLKDMIMKHIDCRGTGLFHIMEHTHTMGVYMLLFD
jgi:hypothetical protein